MLNIMLVYQDRVTEAWAAKVHDQVAHLVGKENIHASWWQISDLIQPGFIADAIWSATQADVIIVAVPTAGELPDDLCVWMDVWLPRRSRGPGVLVMVTGQPEELESQVSPALQYLREVARKGHLDFIPHEPKNQGTTDDSPSGKQSPDSGIATFAPA